MHAVSFTATVTAGATGTVAFKDNGSDITGCGNVALNPNTATCTTSSLSPGSHSITAVYSGDSNFSESTSSAVTQMVATVLRLTGESVAGYYSSIQDAYDDAINGDIIQIINVPFSEVIYFDREDDISVLIQGGCNESFVPVQGEFSTVIGSMEISRGTVIMENLIIK